MLKFVIFILHPVLFIKCTCIPRSNLHNLWLILSNRRHKRYQWSKYTIGDRRLKLCLIFFMIETEVPLNIIENG